MRSTRAMNGAASRAGAGPWRTWRRVVLGALALGALTAPAASSGCVAGFDPPSRVSGLRVFAVTAHKGGSAEVDGAPAPGGSYANPGDKVTFKLHYQDPLGDSGGAPRPVMILWVGGCENPIGDDYYGCYERFAGLAEQFAELAEELGGASPDLGTGSIDLGDVQLGLGEEFTLRLGEDLVSSREPPASGPHYGIAYVFFAACAGTLGPARDDGTGDAGSFPIGCFEYGANPLDPAAQQLGADRFVAGYTQVYAFADERANANPVIEALELTQGDGQELEDPDGDGIPNVPRCALTEDDRRAVGCNAEDPFKTCTAYTLDVVVPADVAEDDPDAAEQAMKEVVWVNYFADQGDLDRGIKLVSDAVKGSLEKHSVKWIPPAEPGVVTLTAVVRDARGGAAVVQRVVQVD